MVDGSAKRLTTRTIDVGIYYIWQVWEKLIGVRAGIAQI